MEEHLSTYIIAALCVVIIIVLPILRALLPTIPKREDMSKFVDETVKPYLVIGG